MKRPEEDLQRQVVRYLDACARGIIWFATANQRGTRGRFEMGILKAMGVRAGVPDLVFVLPGARVFFIELKSKTGRSSEAQLAFAAECLELGVFYTVCRSLPEVEGTLRAMGVDLSGRIAA